MQSAMNSAYYLGNLIKIPLCPPLMKGGDLNGVDFPLFLGILFDAKS